MIVGEGWILGGDDRISAYEVTLESDLLWLLLALDDDEEDDVILFSKTGSK